MIKPKSAASPSGALRSQAHSSHRASIQLFKKENLATPDNARRAFAEKYQFGL
jgi:hypothetical protein